MIAIIDYGMGNLHSVQKALEHFGAKSLITNNPKELESCDKAILPGVGAFDDAVSELKKHGLIAALNKHIKENRVFLGICLGMQLLFESSEEAIKEKGLKVLKGKVVRFEKKKGLKVPHMGWNQLKIPAAGGSASGGKKECPLLRDIADNSYVYFCHSYYPAPKDKETIAATTDYGVTFTSVVWKDNIYGMQFHPEKSQAAGLKMLKNFVDLC